MSTGFLHRLKRKLLPGYFKTLQYNAELLVEQSKDMQARLDRLAIELEYTKLHAARTEAKLESLRDMWLTEALSESGDIKQSLRWRQISGLRALLKVMRPAEDGPQLIRSGSDEDGGYLMLDDLSGCDIAYSFGIADDVSWDKYMAARGFDVYMYDHTIQGLPEENEHFHWQKIGLAGIYREEQPELRTLPMLLRDNGHEQARHMILKMDIEGAELEVFANLPAGFLKAFDQILLELHDMNDFDKYEALEASLNCLNASHQLVHVHGNNCSPLAFCGGLVMPDVIECTYLSKEKYKFQPDDTFYPDKLDQRNDWRWPDIMLGKWG